MVVDNLADCMLDQREVVHSARYNCLGVKLLSTPASQKMKKTTSIAALGLILLIGCSTPPSADKSGLSNDVDAAILKPRYEPDRRESYAILSAGPCIDRIFGNQTSETFTTPIFRGVSAESRKATLKFDVPITMSYSFYISDRICTVAATTIFRAGKRYIIEGGRRFAGSILPVSTGCELQITDADTKEVIPLFPPQVRPNFTVCVRQN